MFLLDSLMIAGIRWTLDTVTAAAEAEMNDDTALREQLLEAELRREMGEMSDADFASLESELLARIREIKERREGAGPLAFGAEPLETTGDSRFQIEASVSGDFHDPADAPHTTVVEQSPAEGGLVQTAGERRIAVLDMEPGEAAGAPAPALPLSVPRRRARAGGRMLPRDAAAGSRSGTRPTGTAAARPRPALDRRRRKRRPTKRTT